MNIAIIPARGGSKRIPGKNIKKFLGKPIIAYSIEAALNSKLFDKIVVSTDDHEIAKVARHYGAETPFVRPNILSDDYSGIAPVMRHAIEWFDQKNCILDDVCLLFATAPFVKASLIKDAYKQFKQEKAEYCISVTSFDFPIQRAVKITKDNRLDMFYPENFLTRSQDLELSYHDAGQFTWGKAKAFRKERPSFSGHSTPYIIPRNLVQDIDTLEDWDRAELMYQILEKEQE